MYYGLMMPKYYRLIEKMKRTKEYQRFYTFIMRGIDSIYPASLTENAPCGQQHQLKTGSIGNEFMPHNIEPHLLKMNGAIKQMPGITANAVFAEYVLYVLCVIKINSHP